MTRKPFLKLLDWFYLHCADNHAALQTKKGMIDVAVWSMMYILDDSLSSTESMDDDLWKQFYQDLITVHKCTGAHAVFHSAKYIGPILRERRTLRDNRDFTVKELYRRHNFAERNIWKRKAVKIKNGPPIPLASSANDTRESTHSSSSNTVNVPDRAHVDEGIGSNSGLPNISSAVASPSTQTVNMTVTTPPIRNLSKHDIAQSKSMTKSITELQAPDQSTESSIATNNDRDSSNSDGESNLVESSIATNNNGDSSNADGDSNLIKSSIAMNDDGDSLYADGESNLVELPSRADAPVISLDVESNQNGLMFRPSCSSFCMTKTMDVTNPCKFPHNDVIDVVLNNPGNYVIFPASTYH